MVGAVSPRRVAHSLQLIPSRQQSKHARTVSWKMRARERTASWTGSVSVELCGEIRREQSDLLGGSCSARTAGKRKRQRRRRVGKVSAMNATPPFEYESKKSQELEMSRKLKVGIVGFGNFGQFLAERMLQQGHFEVVAHSRRDYSDKARKLGVAYFRFVIGHGACTVLISAVTLYCIYMYSVRRDYE